MASLALVTALQMFCLNSEAAGYKATTLNKTRAVSQFTS